MHHYAQQLGQVRIWKEGHSWRYAIDGEPAPNFAEPSLLIDDDGELVIYIARGDRGELIREAVKN
jgi:hypothetical protein